MPRRGHHEPQQILMEPQVIHLNPASILQSNFAGEYLKKNFWKMSKELGKKYECSVCLEEINCADGCERCFCLLNCGHVFHYPCITRCPQMSCPLCRDSHPTT